MTPEFDDLVGGDLDPAERARLERVHELLVSAGPPPALRTATVVEFRPRRARRAALVAIAAALAISVFAFGAAALESSSGAQTIAMQGTPAAPSATASLELFPVDSAGNWPMRMTVAGLPPSASGRHYELWLTRNGKREALCGSFLTSASGSTVVPMNAPYRFAEYDGWVVVEQGSETPLIST
jgi:hypothetical protein